MKKLICIFLAVLLVLSIAACTKPDSAPKEDTAAAPDAQVTNPPEEEPQIVTPDVNPDLGIENETFSFVNDPQQVLDRPHKIQPGTEVTTVGYDVNMYLPWMTSLAPDLFSNIYEGLVYCYMGRADDVRGLIAQSWSVSEDYLTWTFKIREGVKFTDGTVCDAAAVAEAWDYFLYYDTNTLVELKIKSWEAVDGDFVVYLREPCPGFEWNVGDIYILSPTALKLWGDIDNRAAVGTAPYYVSEYLTAPRKGYGFNPGTEFIIKANPDYYLYERMPVIETIRKKVIFTSDELVQTIIDGEVDIASFSGVDSYKKLVESGYDGTVICSSGSSSLLALNAGVVPEFGIYEVRKAMNRFIDLNKVNDVLYDGLGVVQSSIWSVGSLGEVPWPEGYYYAPEEGLELLAAAGIAPEDFSFHVKSAISGTDCMEAISAQLAEVGIVMEVTEHSPESSLLYDWQATAVLIGSFSYSNSTPHSPWSYSFETNKQYMNFIWSDIYDSELYDQMKGIYETMKTEHEWDELVAYSKTLTDLLQRDYGAMPGVQTPIFVAFDKELKGVVMVTENHVPLWNYLYW